MMRAKEERQGTIYSNGDLKRLILPLIMEQLLAILVGMLDTVMISGVGEAAVSGIGHGRRCCGWPCAGAEKPRAGGKVGVADGAFFALFLCRHDRHSADSA